MRMIEISIAFIILSSITAAQEIITFDDQGWNSDQTLNSAFTINNYNFSGSQKFCTNYGYNFDVNSTSVYFVFQNKQIDQITIITSDNQPVNLNSLDVYQVSERSTDSLVIEGWNGTVKEYSQSFVNDTSWNTLNLNYQNINKVVIKLDSTGNGGIADYNFDNFTFSSSPMPVELVEFKAKTDASNINLEWGTATEVNNYGFDIERSQKSEVSSQNSQSGSSYAQWQKIGFVKGNGTSYSPKNYNFKDNSVNCGYSYKYRLKQIDNNGDFKYSGEIEVKANPAPKDYSLSQNYPNPFNPSTAINYKLAKPGKVVLKVYDILGKEVATLVNEYKDAGKYSATFSVEDGFSNGSNSTNLPSGIYIYELRVVPSAGSGQDFAARNKMMLLK